jgi:hypothetical protein
MYTDFDLRKFEEIKTLAEVQGDGWTIKRMLFVQEENFIAAFGERSKNEWSVRVCEEMLRIVKRRSVVCAFKFLQLRGWTMLGLRVQTPRGSRR